MPRTLILLLAFPILFSCKKDKDDPAPPPAPIEVPENIIIPMVNSFIADPSSNFSIGANTKVLYADPSLEFIAADLQSWIQKVHEISLTAESSSGQVDGEHIMLQLDAGQQNADEESYELEISNNAVVLSAPTYAGMHNAAQTFKQLLFFGLAVDGAEKTISLNGVSISDSPRYAWRGSMLDIARHFFPKKDIIEFIDQIALFKINRLHLHLTDDQGWRIVINSWPKLTSIGGSTEVGGGTGGYLTQEDYAEIVEYAAKKNILIIPEIDIPGHTNAALASYAELNCDGIAKDLYTHMGVGFSSLCIDKNITYQFVSDVLTELAAITPGPYIHIGGDEASTTAHEDYVFFIDSVNQMIGDLDKTMIGWEEINEANITSTEIVQHWMNKGHLQHAIENGNSVILSPAHKIYMDMKYQSSTPLGLEWAGHITSFIAYDWNPETYHSGLSDQNILGIEAPLWTETVETKNDIEYMVFPRIMAVSELAWSQENQRSWEDFENRVTHYGKFLKAASIDYGRDPSFRWETP